MKIKLINAALLLTVMLFITESAFAQQIKTSKEQTEQKETKNQTKKDKKKATGFTSRLWYGGGTGLRFNNLSFNLKLSPMIGYKVTEKFSTGIRIPLHYNYSNFRDWGNYSNLNYGAGVFSRYKFSKYIFAHAEYNHLRGNIPTLSESDKLIKQKFQKNELNLGLGFSTSGKIGYEFSILYNALEDFRKYDIPPLSVRVGINYKF